MQGKLGTGYELGEQWLHIAQRLQDVASLTEAHWLMGGISYFRGEFTQALVHLNQGLELFMPAPPRARQVLQYPDVGCLGFAAQTLWTLGYPDRAKERIQEALALVQQLNHPYSVIWSHHFAAMLYSLCGDIQTAQAHAETCIRLATEQGSPLWAAAIRLVRRHGSY